MNVLCESRDEIPHSISAVSFGFRRRPMFSSLFDLVLADNDKALLVDPCIRSFHHL
jgi:hypothetical protein